MSNSITINGIPVGTIGTPSPAPCPTSASLCDLTTPAECVVYTGSTLPYIGVVNNDNLKEALRKIDLTLLTFTADGIPGPIGLTGPAGPVGPQGPTGPAGVVGATGPAGAVGPQGLAGVKGDTGLQGLQGNIGNTGSQGPQGVEGPQGPQGLKGDIGLTGLQGPQGNPGPQGLKGETGSVGPTGPQGLVGPQGPQGAAALWQYRGAWSGSTTYVAGDIVTYQGSSYYTLTGNVSNYPPGTVLIDWALISSKGETGTTGSVGPQGLQGPQGPQGDIGATGAAALWNYKGVWSGSTSYVAGDIVTYQGSSYYTLSGIVGSNAPGTVGIDWSIIAAKGSTGAVGPQGDIGPQGLIGPEGPQGLNALWNYRGVWSGSSTYAAGDLVTYQGSTYYTLSGAVGNNVPGTIGVDWAVIATKGSTGSTGATGPEGPAGPQGEQGIQGIQGETGPAGTNGTSVTILGTVGSVGALPFTGNTNGDAYILSTNGHLYVWSATAWTDVGQIQGPAGAPGATVFSGLTDVQLSTLVNNQLVRYNASTQKWENFTPTYISANQTITASGDVVTTTGTTSLSLILNSIATPGTYNNVTIDAKGRVLSGSSVSYLTTVALSNLTDVTLTSIQNNQLLKYDTATSKWINFTANYLTANQTITVSGDVITATGTTSLSFILNTVATAGTYNSVTIDAKGRVLSGANLSYLTSAALSTLTDVTLTSVQNNQLLKYDSGTSKWINWTANYLTANQTITVSGDVVTATGTTSLSLILNSITTAGTYNTVTVDTKGRVTSGVSIGYLTSAALSILTDVTLTGVANNQLLKYDTATSKWVNFTPTYISGNQSITISGDATGSGTTSIPLTLAVVNGNVGTFGSASKIPRVTVNAKGLVTAVTEVDVTIVSTLAGLSDVTIATPTNNQLLRYSTAIGKWENFTPSYISSNQTITFTTAGTDIVQNNTVASPTTLAPNFTVAGLKDKALPALSAGFLKYSGTAWTFDPATYLTSYTETDPIFVSWRDLTRSANMVWAGPSTGSPAAASFRQLGVAEITGAAPLASPTFTGIPAAPTAASGTNTTQLATTAFVQAALTAAGSITNLDSLTDVVITTPATGQLLQYNGTNWVNWVPTYITSSQTVTLIGDIAGSGALSTSITTTLATVNSNVGTFGNSTTIPIVTVNAKGLVTSVTTATVASGASSIATLTDVNTSANGVLANNQFLKYNTATSKWENYTLPAYLTANTAISFTASGDVSNTTVSSASALTPSITVNGIKGVAVPTLAAGRLRYTGSAWDFDNASYLTSAVTTINFGTTGLTPASATSGAITVAGTLNVANGGTGATTLTGILVGNGTSAVTAIAGTGSQLLRRNAGNTAYEFFTLPAYITANQSITFTASGDVSGSASGTTAISPTLTLASIVTAVGSNTFLKLAYDVKGRITGSTAVVSSDITGLLSLGVANGIATLGSDAKVPASQLPSYVDDILEYINLASFPVTGETGKIYVDLATNKIYRWGGSVYTEVSPSVGTAWGGISGTLSNQTDLQTALNAKQNTITVTTSGTSGAATFTGGTLNIPNYTYTYTLPNASASVLGGIKVGSGLSIDGTGILSTTYSYSLPTASTTVLGGVKVDGTTITINGSGVISGASTYSLPVSTASILGGVKIGSGVSVDAAGVISVSTNYQAPLSGGTGLLVLTGSTISYVGTSTYYLASNPSGYTSNAGTVTNITFNSGNGTTTSGGPITTTGTITIGSTGDNIRINSLGVGVAASNTTGRIDASNDIVGFSSSDIRLKKDVSILENATEALSKLRGVSYIWDPQSFDIHGFTGKDYGIIAQDVEKVFPEMVQHRDNGYMAVRYEKLIGVLVAAVNEQSKRIQELEARL